MRRFVITLGFDEKFANRCLLRRGLGKGDEVYLILNKDPDARVIKASSQVERIVMDAQAELKKIFIDPMNVYQSIESLVKIFNTYSQIIINLSGGMRILLIYTVLSFLMSEGWRKEVEVKVEIDTEDMRNTVEIPVELLTNLAFLQLSERSIELLQAIKDESRSLWEISQKIGLDESVISRHMEQLETRKFIEGVIIKRKKHIKLTSLGKLYLATLQK
ncbi:MAG: CRISPR-associated CARF protein Csa3 [Thermoproteota archaeon]